MKNLHLHSLRGKEKILRKIFQEYSFNETAIDNFLEGSDIYQFEVPFENGSSRVVFQKIDNLISFLFLDPNHHIYMNENIVHGNGSLFYEYCPINIEGVCERMNYFDTCFAFEYLDEEKYKSSFDNSYSFDESR